MTTTKKTRYEDLISCKDTEAVSDAHKTAWQRVARGSNPPCWVQENDTEHERHWADRNKKKLKLNTRRAMDDGTLNIISVGIYFR